MQVQLLYEAKQITQYVKPNLLRLTYTDYLSDQSDELQVEFEDIERKWVGS